MTTQFTLGIQVFLVFPPEGKPLIGLALTAQLPATVDISSWKNPFDNAFGFHGLYGISPKSLPFEPLLAPPAPLALPAPAVATLEEDTDDAHEFLRFVDPAYKRL